MNRKIGKNTLKALCEKGNAAHIAEKYIATCRAPDDTAEDGNSSSSKRSGASGRRFPNLAGLCRYAQIGISEFDELAKEYPNEIERIYLVLEDEALNSGLPPALISAYMKKRLGYEKEFERGDTRALQVRFEHDIFNDGE